MLPTSFPFSQPVHGHQTGQSCMFSPTQNSSIFIVHDNEVELTTAALTQSLDTATLPSTPYVKGTPKLHAGCVYVMLCLYSFMGGH